MTTKLKVLDLYSGIGGFSLGFHRAGGFETVGFCEIDEHCGKVLKKNFPNVYIYKNVKDFHGNMNIKIKDSYMPFRDNVDVVCGGFPCQDVSVAGKQRGLIDEKGKTTRSGLWFEFKRIIKEVRPRWVVIENVRNLLNNGFATVLQDLHEIGFDAEWEIISARSVNAPHLRERIWIVAYPRCGERRPSYKRNTEEFRGEQTDEEEVRSFNPFEAKRSSDGRQAYPRGMEVATDSQRKRLERFFQKRRDRRGLGKEQKEKCSNEILHKESSNGVSDSDDFRFWPAFATEKEKQQWWAEATFSFRDWWEVEPEFCRVAHGLLGELDKGRSQRIKQLGNSIVPQIAEIIGKRIMFHEGL
jgi:DNA (cytosine-5)-methyltransferase 1